MSQYLLSTYAVEGDVPGAPRTPDEMQGFMERVMALEAEMDADRAFVFGGALHGPEAASVTEQKMFGGISFMIGGRMAVGVVRDDLMVRVGPDAHDEALASPHVRPMDFTGRPMRGFVYVAPAGLADDPELQGWVEVGASFAASQPPSKGR